MRTAMDGHRTPRPDTAQLLADALGVPVTDLWPFTGVRPGLDAPTVVSRVFPARTEIPSAMWREVFTNTRERIDVLVYGGTFLFDAVPQFTRIIDDAAARGVRIRFAVGDPASAAVHARGVEEGIGLALAARCQMTLTRLIPVARLDGVEVRMHGTPLYTSMFFADDAVYANHHIYRQPAGDNPVFELTRDAHETLFGKYADTFEHVWATGTPVVPHPH
ncbi:hypothetical protein ABS642_07505 [Microbacterium sp. A8/3-1]|uniref:HTH cro/C1-type domain-containing protein n=1 Tax=Microbacterium sp. A8/3-1 TaxID=3160749 RepID=A0AAU7W1V5_9MICO